MSPVSKRGFTNTLLTKHHLIMSTTFTWSIYTLERETSDGYVYRAHYRVDAADGTYTTDTYDSVGLERPETLIPYSDLTEEVVIGWVQEAIGGEEKVAEVEAGLQAQLDKKRQPTEANGVPWGE